MNNRSTSGNKCLGPSLSRICPPVPHTLILNLYSQNGSGGTDGGVRSSHPSDNPFYSNIDSMPDIRPRRKSIPLVSELVSIFVTISSFPTPYTNFPFYDFCSVFSPWVPVRITRTQQ